MLMQKLKTRTDRGVLIIEHPITNKKCSKYLFDMFFILYDFCLKTYRLCRERIVEEKYKYLIY